MIKTVSKTKNLNGEIVIPSDKSISHRAIMFASLAKGSSKVINFSCGKDCWSTLEAFRNLGIEINLIDEKNLKIISNGTLLAPNKPLDMGNSGTTTRLITGILAGESFDSILIGDESLSKRPMKRIIEPLSLMGANIESQDGKLPLKIKGSKLYGIEYSSKIASAQVKSCIILAGINPKTKGKTIYTEPKISRNHTELMLKHLGASIETENTKTIVYPSELIAKDIEIVGDISSAAFFIVAGLIIEGSEFIIRNVGLNPTRTGILDIVKRMNGNIEILNEHFVCGEKVGDIKVAYSDSLKACDISGEDIPRLIDELPIIAILASQAEGCSIISDAQDLRNKETDRIGCLVTELKKIGVDIEEALDGFIVHGKTKLKGNAELNTYHDHRLAMSFYIAGLICEQEIAINDFEWINISFPEFEKLLANLC